MKALPKHLRPRWRYLAVELESWPDAGIDRGAFQRGVWYAAGNLLGDAGSAELDLRVLGFAFADGAGHAVVRTRRGEIERARAVLACVSEIEGTPVGVHVRGTSGTVRACEEKYLPEPGRKREASTVRFAGSEVTAYRSDDAVDVRTSEGFAGATRLDAP